MKKIVISLFFILNLIAVSAGNKGNYDVAKYRQDVVNYAMAQVGKAYSQANRMGANTYDCSSFVDRTSQAAGMSSVTGANTKNWANTTASMRAGAKATKIATNQIKPGDAILFNGHVVYAIGIANGCSIDVVHASNSKPYPKGGVKVSKGYNICKAHGGYSGVITAEQVLINNGYTPVNSDGTVAVPPAGSTVSANGGHSGNNASTASTKSSLSVDWDNIQNEFVQMINSGIEKMTPGLLVLLSVLTVFEIMWILYGYIVKNVLENLWMSLLRIMIRFSILAYVIPNAISLIDMGYGIFSGIGSYFMGNSGGTVTLNSIWAIAGRETGKILKIINESNFNFFNIITDSRLFFEELGKMLLLIGVIILIYYFVVRIIFEMMMAVLQFRMALGLSWIFLPFDVNAITKRDLGNKVLTTLFLTGSKIVVIMALGGIVFKNLDAAGFGEVTFKELKYETIFLFITVGMVMAFVMNEADKITTTLAKGN